MNNKEDKSMIHPTAIVSESAVIADSVKIGAYCVVGDNVTLCDNVELVAHVCIDGCTYVGSGTKIFPFASIGYQPQDLKFNGEKTELYIGEGNVIREYVTIHPGTVSGAMKTVVGDNNLLMIAVHIAHDCVVGNNIVLANQCTLAGHVTIEDNVIIGGLSAVHQFVRIGHNAIIGGLSGVDRDVIPYGAVKGERAHLYGLNIVGMKRANIDKQDIQALLAAYKILFDGKNDLSHNIQKLKMNFADNQYVETILNFMNQETNRSFCLPKK